MKDKKKIILSILGILLLVLATVGVTFAVFTYTKLGTTENTVTTGTLKFLYTENTGVGNGINIENAFPVSDEVGKGYNTDKYVFDFSVESTNSGTEEIPYEVTLRKKDGSTLSNDSVKVYLTDMTEDSDTAIVGPVLYSDLVQTSIDVEDNVEKTIYNDTVLGGELTYKKDFRLRMWIDEKSNQDDINGKTFTALVNVYSNVPLVSEEEVELRKDVQINSVTASGVIANEVSGQNYHYLISLPEGTTSTVINVETTNPNSEVKIEKIDNLTYMESNVTRLSLSKTVQLTSGDNYFKVSVISENKEVSEQYILRIVVNVKNELTGFAKIIYNSNQVISVEPNLTTSSNNTSDVSGLYKSIATNDGKPTYYFRGGVENNYVDFAGYTWRIVRINEDGTVRLIMQEGINNNTTYKFNSNYGNFSHMYYSNSNAQVELKNWFDLNLSNYLDRIVMGDYYCEQARVTYTSNYSAGSEKMTPYSNYTPTFTCNDDKNGYGIINSNVGLITYDEVVYAGGYFGKDNKAYYLYNSYDYWTMTGAGFSTGGKAAAWRLNGSGNLYQINSQVSYSYSLRPVINIKPDVTVTGTGDGDNHYKIQ